MTDLKPCPFCGGEGIVDPHDNDTWCIIRCKECGASTNAFSSIVDSSHYWNTRCEAAKAKDQPVDCSLLKAQEMALAALHHLKTYGPMDRGMLADTIRTMWSHLGQHELESSQLAKAQPWPGVGNVELMQIATNAFCRHNPVGYNWSGAALEAACKAYHKAALPAQPVDTGGIAHQLELAFPQISLSALSDIIEYFRPYLRHPSEYPLNAEQQPARAEREVQ